MSLEILQASSGFDIKLVKAIASIALVGLSIYLIINAIFKLRNERCNLQTAKGF